MLRIQLQSVRQAFVRKYWLSSDMIVALQVRNEEWFQFTSIIQDLIKEEFRKSQYAYVTSELPVLYRHLCRMC